MSQNKDTDFDQSGRRPIMEVHQHGYWSEVNKEREFCILGTRFFWLDLEKNITFLNRVVTRS